MFLFCQVTEGIFVLLEGGTSHLRLLSDVSILHLRGQRLYFGELLYSLLIVSKLNFVVLEIVERHFEFDQNFKIMTIFFQVLRLWLLPLWILKSRAFMGSALQLFLRCSSLSYVIFELI